MNANEIIITYGQDPAKMTREVLERAQPAIPPNAKIGIKPNLVVARPCSEGATTSPVIVGALIEYLKDKGAHDIVILEGSWVGDSTKRAFRACGYEELSKKYGVKLIDTQKDSYVRKTAGGVSMELCSSVLAVDYLINVPVLKGHCQTKVTGALKNMKGIISDAEKRRFHTMGLHKPIALLNTLVKADFVLVDGMCGDLDFEEGGNPVIMNRVFAALDPVLCDAYIAMSMGYDVSDIGYIGLAGQYGVGSADLGNMAETVLAKDTSKAKPMSSNKAAKLAKYVDEKDACSACYANLIHALARMDRQGRLRSLDSKICIGQAYKGVQKDAVGVGNCTSGLSKSLTGCPPTAAKIVEHIQEKV